MRKTFLYPSNSEAGLSLIEILVTIAIIALVMGVGFVYVFPSDVSKAKEDARHLAGTIRLAYNEAILNQKYVRMVFDLDKRAYYLETSANAFFVEKTSPEEKTTTQDPDSEELAPKAEGFTQKEESLFAPVTLNSDIKFKDILVAHSDKPVESGREYMHFLPTGWAEPTIINLTNEDEKVFFSIEVNPLTARVEIRDEYYQLETKELSPES